MLRRSLSHTQLCTAAAYECSLGNPSIIIIVHILPLWPSLSSNSLVPKSVPCSTVYWIGESGEWGSDRGRELGSSLWRDEYVCSTRLKIRVNTWNHVHVPRTLVDSGPLLVFVLDHVQRLAVAVPCSLSHALIHFPRLLVYFNISWVFYPRMKDWGKRGQGSGPDKGSYVDQVSSFRASTEG